MSAQESPPEQRFRQAWEQASDAPDQPPGWEDAVLLAAQQAPPEAQRPDLLTQQFVAAAALLLVAVSAWALLQPALEASLAASLVQQTTDPITTVLIP